MNSKQPFLLRLIVAQFYKQNTGLFLFLFLLFFGIIPPQHLIATHATLIQAQLSNIPLMVGVSFFWVLYAGRCIRFSDQILSKYSHSLLNLYQVLPKRKIFRQMSSCFLIMYLPVLVYGLLLISIATNQAIYWYVMGATPLLIITSICSVTWMTRSLLNPKESSKNHWKIPLLTRTTLTQHISLKFVLLSYLWHDKKIGLVAQKLFSYLCFNFFFIRNASIFREDYFTFFIFLMGAMNALLIFNTHKLTEEKLSFLRNLPLSMSHRIFMIMMTALVLFVPELIMMFISGYELLSALDSLILYGILGSQFVLLFSILYTSSLSLKKYVQYIFLLLLSYLFLYLLLPTVLIILFNLGLAFLIYHEQYHAYEYKVVKK